MKLIFLIIYNLVIGNFTQADPPNCRLQTELNRVPCFDFKNDSEVEKFVQKNLLKATQTKKEDISNVRILSQKGSKGFTYICTEESFIADTLNLQPDEEMMSETITPLTVTFRKKDGQTIKTGKKPENIYNDYFITWTRIGNKIGSPDKSECLVLTYKGKIKSVDVDSLSSAQNQPASTSTGPATK